MAAQTRVSAKGQVVIPKEVRERLRLVPGRVLDVVETADGVLLRPQSEPRERISFDEFRARVPRHGGPAASIEEMNRAVARMFAEKGRP